MAKKFIIITTARSGSQMLCEFLDNQLNIRCEFEILQSQKEKKHMIMYAKGRASYGCLESHNKCLEILGDDPSKFVGNRNRRFIEYLKIWEDVIPCDFFGFKVFFKHHLGTHKLSQEDAISYEDFAKYIKDNDIKIIHLTRDNTFLKYISALTSRITGVHSSSSTSEINSISVEVFYKQFNNFKDNFIEEKQSVVDFGIKNDIDIHHVTYENLTGPNHADFYKDILSFIGADPNLFIDIRDTPNQNKRKTNIFSLRHKVSNLDQLIEEATKAGDTELLDIINIELNKG
jgi:LPS sulfotransferase NodH